MGGSPLANKTRYKVKKVMNNNVILVVEPKSSQEIILVGKGLGFGKKDNMVIELADTQIEKAFHTFDKKVKEDYFNLLTQLDENVIGISEEIIALAEDHLGKLNEHIHIVLTDHIGFALERIKMDMDINNPFLFEIKSLYPQEFEMGKRAAKMIKSRFNIEISESEMGFIALHLHSARQNKDIRETVKDTRLLKESVKIVEDSLNVKIDPEELTYFRLINHLRLAINRMEERKNIKNPLLETIKQKFEVSFRIAKAIGAYIQQNKEVEISEDELGYMAIHIERLKELAKVSNE